MQRNNNQQDSTNNQSDSDPSMDELGNLGNGQDARNNQKQKPLKGYKRDDQYQYNDRPSYSGNNSKKKRGHQNNYNNRRQNDDYDYRQNRGQHSNRQFYEDNRQQNNRNYGYNDDNHGYNQRPPQQQNSTQYQPQGNNQRMQNPIQDPPPNYQQPQPSQQLVQNNNIVVNLLKQDSTQQQFNELQNFINATYGSSNIQIIISDPDPLLLDQIQQMQECFQSVQIICQKSGIISPQQSKIISSQLDNDFIIQIQPQVDNNVPQDMKTIIIHWKILPEMVTLGQQNNIRIQINLQDYQYKLVDNSNSQINNLIMQNLQKFYLRFVTIINDSVILIHNCQSDIEAKTKTQILQDRYLQDILAQQFKTNQIIIDSMINIQLQFFQHAILECAKYFKDQYIVFALIKNDFNLPIRQLQSIFDQTIQNQNYIKNIKEKKSIELSVQPDMINIKQQAQLIDNQGISINFVGPHYNSQTNKFQIEIFYELWMIGNTEQRIITERLTVLQQKIYEIFNPIIYLQITKENQIKIWDLYLEFQYRNQKEMKVNKQKNATSIQLVGEKQSNEKTKYEIETQLDVLDYTVFEFKDLDKDKNLFKTLKKRPLDLLFFDYLEEIRQLCRPHFLSVLEVDERQKQISFHAVHEKASRDYLSDAIRKQIIQKLEYQQLPIDMQAVFQYYQKKKEQFEKDYSCYLFVKNQQEASFVTLRQYVKDIKQAIEDYQESIQVKSKVVKVIVSNKLFLESVNNALQNGLLNSKIHTQSIQNTIQLSGPEDLVTKSEQLLESYIKELQHSLKTGFLKIYEKEWDFLQKHKLQDIQIMEQNYQCQIESSKISDQNEGMNAAVFKFQNKEIIIRYGDIVKQKCDSIVNSCNSQMTFGDPTMLSGVAKKIAEYAGPQYEKHSKNIIQKNGQLYGADLFKIQNPTNIKNIISVATQNYIQAGQNITQFAKNVKDIFDVANTIQIKSLALPILGGGSAGFFFQTVCNDVLKSIIKQTEVSLWINKVIIVENNKQNIQKIVQSFKELLNPPQKRQIVYQWQWYDSDGWKDYDDFEINQQIDIAYEEFITNNVKNEVKLVFPYTKLPGTHTVDLARMLLTDISLKKTSVIELKQYQLGRKYHFDGQPVHDALNEFMELQKQNGQMKFDIFYKRHKIVFAINKIVQINEETKFERQVQGLKYTKPQIKQDVITIKGYTFNEESIDKKQEIQSEQLEVQIKTLLPQNIDAIKSEIVKIIKHNTTIVQWDVLNLKQEEYSEVEKVILKNSICKKGEIKVGSKLEISCLKKKAQKLIDYFELLKKDKLLFPQSWIAQDTNMIKVEVQVSDPDYTKAKELFLKCNPTGKIYQINRIQNKSLYENFQREKQKLMQIRANQHQNLSDIELERYLWHGVRNNHPKMIYSGDKEAFDPTYSNEACMWGPGIYFAENSIYSKNYSYKLQPQDSTKYAGKLIFLLCLVATGKIQQLQPDSTLRRPPNGFDCVQGNTGGSDVFILYGLDVRRAYPAFERFEKQVIEFNSFQGQFIVEDEDKNPFHYRSIFITDILNINALGEKLFSSILYRNWNSTIKVQEGTIINIYSCGRDERFNDLTQ
ncbi:hypothetical protein pb186bvf_000493 [Paramecium bursaria]